MVGVDRNFKLIYEANKQSLEKDVIEEHGSDQSVRGIQARQSVNHSLKHINVSQIKIKVSKEVPNYVYRPKSVTPDIMRGKYGMKRNMADLSDHQRKSGSNLRSYTCIDLDQVKQSRIARKIKSAKAGIVLLPLRNSSVIIGKHHIEQISHKKKLSSLNPVPAV